MSQAVKAAKQVDRVANSSLVAQRGLFAGLFPWVDNDLYAHVISGTAARERAHVAVEPHTKVSMNTYFGRFPASYWQRWTKVTEATVELVVTGSGHVSICASDSLGEQRKVAAQEISGNNKTQVALTAKIDRFVDGGALWVEIETGDQQLVVEQVHWKVQAPEVVRPTAIVICTHNRVEHCLNTLATIAADMESLSALEAIYVVDQGSDQLDRHPRFVEVSVALADKLHYIKQPNLGGAGGFSRGLYEVAGVDHSEHANVLFMDDDIAPEPDTILRVTAFANRTVEPIIVGGQMLHLFHPNTLKAGAEYVDLNMLAADRVVKHALAVADVADVDSDRQERRVDAGHNAWWTCLIPSEIIKKCGYPLPVFFQFDDIEYGLRARSQGHATITLPGAGVWHAEHSWKDADDWSRYFSVRNSLIVAALHSSFNTKSIVQVLRQQLTHHLLAMQYGLAATLIKAIEDFLQGPGVLKDGGAAAMADVRKLRAAYPETIRHSANDVPGFSASNRPIVNALPAPSREQLVLVKRLAYHLLGKHAYSVGSVPVDEAQWWHVSLFNTAVVTDASQEAVRVRHRDRHLLLELGKKGLTVLARLRREAPMVQRRYRAAMPELTSRENWKRLYGL